MHNLFKHEWLWGNFFPYQAEWIEDLTDEVLHFPNAKYDDQVDVLSLMGRGLDKTTSGKSINYQHSDYKRSQIVMSEMVKSHLNKQNKLRQVLR